MPKKKAHRDRDRYYNLAKEQGYRARSAFKLIQINKKYDFLSSASILIDLCAAPGGWLQVAAKSMPAASTIIGVDLMPIKPIRNVITHQVDITVPRCRQLLRRDMGPRKADVVLHDGAPNVGADWVQDAYTQSTLTLCSLKLATEFLKPGGLFITKVFRSTDYHSLLWVFQQLFERVEATKPHSSRSTSAEIFVVCKNYKAPEKLDPRFLDPKHVFKELDAAAEEDEETTKSGGAAMGSNAATLRMIGMNKILDEVNNAKRRHRGGYDDDLGQTLRRRISAYDFLAAADPVSLLARGTEMVFEGDQGTAVAKLGCTTREVMALCEDLQVLGRSDLKALLRWRLKARRHMPEFGRKPAAEAGQAAGAAGAADEGADGSGEEEEEEEGDGSGEEEDGEGGSDSDSDGIDADMRDAVERQRRRQRREKKRAQKQRMRLVKRRAMGLDASAVDHVADEELFSLEAWKKADAATRDAITDVQLHEVDQSAIPQDPDAADEEEREEKDEDGEDSGASDVDSDEERYQELEDDMDRQYADYLAKRGARTTVREDQDKTGKKLSRRKRLEVEAKVAEEQRLQKLDFAHQQYLKMLAGARPSQVSGDAAAFGGLDQTAGSGDSDSDDDSSDSEEEDEEEEPVAAPAPPSKAATAADEWFSMPFFGEEDAVVDADESEEEEEADSDEEGGRRTGRKRGRRPRQGEDELAVDEDGVPNFLKDLPKSDRERRKDKLRKLREKAEEKKARQAAKSETGKSAAKTSFNPLASIGAGRSTEAQRALIEAGMGRAVGGGDDKADSGKAGAGKGSVGFDIVPVAEAGAVDPRLLDYDSDTHAEMLALGKMMRKHTSAKALVDASYNRFAFDDDALPEWFAADERRHYKPTLPISKTDVDKIKHRFREISARPIHKVAEARARKRRRADKRMEKARRKAEAIAGEDDMTEGAKMRAIRRAYRNVEVKRPGSVYVVAGRSGVRGGQGGKGGGKVKVVDKRLKADKRAMQRAERRKKGGRRR